MKDYFRSTANQLRLDLEFDYEQMLEEAKRLKDRFVTHRQGSYDHKGWRSLVLHGLSESSTDYYKEYGYDSSVKCAEDSIWTKAAEESPVTMDFLLNKFPKSKFARVRFMLLEAGGHIGTHKDSSIPLLENINISLSNPEGCVWHWDHDNTTLDMPPGTAWAMNIHYPHRIVNNSNEDRYHLIVHRVDSSDEWKDMINKACIKENVTGEYFTHEVLI